MTVGNYYDNIISEDNEEDFDSLRQTTFLKVRKVDFESNVPMNVYSEIVDRRKKYQDASFKKEEAYEFQFEGDTESIQDIIDVLVKGEFEFEITEINGSNARCGKGLFLDGKYVYMGTSYTESEKAPLIVDVKDILYKGQLRDAYKELQNSPKLMDDYKKFEKLISEMI